MFLVKIEGILYRILYRFATFDFCTDSRLNGFRASGTVSAGVVEGLNLKVKLTMRKSFGFRTPEAIETALFHNLGDLPEPELTHEFR